MSNVAETVWFVELGSDGWKFENFESFVKEIRRRLNFSDDIEIKVEIYSDDFDEYVDFRDGDSVNQGSKFQISKGELHSCIYTSFRPTRSHCFVHVRFVQVIEVTEI